MASANGHAEMTHHTQPYPLMTLATGYQFSSGFTLLSLLTRFATLIRSLTHLLPCSWKEIQDYDFHDISTHSAM